MEIVSRAYFSPTQMDIAPLVQMEPEKLKAMEADSIEAERNIYAQMEALAAQWVRQAMETQAARKAQHYLTVQPAPHTSNQWRDGEYDWHERSNMVYKFTWRVYENTRWSKTAGRSVPVSWELTWSVTYNTPRDPDDTSTGRQIAGQSQKRFTDKAAMEKYLQGRIAAYDHLFQEISPPIPAAHRKRFCIHGVLLPGYAVETSIHETADNLMDFLDDSDLPSKKPDRPAPHKSRKHTLTR